MKKLSQFLSFNITEFLKDKQLVCNGIQPWKDHDTGKLLGSKVEAIIFEDKTDYGPSKDGSIINNRFEKLFIKVPHAVNIPVNTVIALVNPVGTVWGDYHDKLSIVAEDVRVLSK